MDKKYLVTGNWMDKLSGKRKSGISEIIEGINKNGQPYAIANTDSREAPIEGSYPIGTILIADMSLSVQKQQNAIKQN